MRLLVQIGDTEVQLDLPSAGANPGTCALAGEPLEVDLCWIRELPGRALLSLLIGSRSYRLWVEQPGPEEAAWRVFSDDSEVLATILDPRRYSPASRNTHKDGLARITAPMPGRVVKLLVQAGDAIEAHQPLLVLEAMKMQNEVRSPKSGRVRQLAVSEGAAVSAQELLAEIE